MDEVHFSVLCSEKKEIKKTIKIKLNESILIERIAKLSAISCTDSAAVSKSYFGSSN